MRRSPHRRLVLALAASLLLAAEAALAADPVGAWALDKKAALADMKRVVLAEVERAGAGEAELEEIGASLDAQVDELMGQFPDVVVFRPDGEVRLEGGDGDEGGGRWSAVGDSVRVVDGDEPVMSGTLDGDVMRLRREAEDGGGPPLEFTLRRR